MLSVGWQCASKTPSSHGKGFSPVPRSPTVAILWFLALLLFYYLFLGGFFEDWNEGLLADTVLYIEVNDKRRTTTTYLKLALLSF
jgi:hypothetical protein